jgi:hypothetical protein
MEKSIEDLKAELIEWQCLYARVSRALRVEHRENKRLRDKIHTLEALLGSDVEVKPKPRSFLPVPPPVPPS